MPAAAARTVLASPPTSWLCALRSRAAAGGGRGRRRARARARGAGRGEGGNREGRARARRPASPEGEVGAATANGERRRRPGPTPALVALSQSGGAQLSHSWDAPRRSRARLCAPGRAEKGARGCGRRGLCASARSWDSGAVFGGRWCTPAFACERRCLRALELPVAGQTLQSARAFVPASRTLPGPRWPPRARPATLSCVR